MGLAPWQAGTDVIDLFKKVKEKHHHPRLELANFAVCFTDSKPFVKGRFNWGKVQKFSPLAKLWHGENNKYDFLVIICGEAWQNILTMSQREALVDLHLTRCDVDFEPEVNTDPVTGKETVVKDGFGRIQMSNNIKYDDEGVPKWKVHPLDLHVFTENVTRYGVWSEELLDFKKAVEDKQEQQVPVAGNQKPENG
jgi:hypothetical protein